MTPTESLAEIDFNHLNQYVDGDLALTQELFGLFQHQVEMWGRALIAETDDETWESVTHALKGSANAIGALKLAQLCHDAEALIGARNRPGLRDVAVQNIEFRMSQAMAEIKRWEYRQTMNKLKQRE